MRTACSIVIGVVGWGFMATVLPGAELTPEELDQAAHQAVYGCRSRGGNIQTLRQAGPAGLAAIVKLHQELTLGLRTTGEPAQAAGDSSAEAAQRKNEELQLRLKIAAEVIDAVGGQRDCLASQLYWHTDWDQALAAARETGKPILTLRMLGKLTDELSCANSRFFRTVLYANTEVSQALREKYILHWQSVRPVPVVTIDFGDGRKLQTTVTGNSIHYVVDPQGRLVDGIPGLIGPKAFLRQLQASATFIAQQQQASADEWLTARRSFHAKRLVSINLRWQDDLSQLNVAVPGTTPTATYAQARQALQAGTAPLDAMALRFAGLERATTEELWPQLAQLHTEDGQLDVASQALLASKNPTAVVAGERAFGKGRVEDPLVRVLRNFQNAVAVDTVRNEYLLHRQIHQRLAQSEPEEVNALNEWVYAQLFLTPTSDPFLGLVPANVYSALPNNGVVLESSARQ